MPSGVAQSAVDWLRGDDAVLYRPVPEELGKRHINQLLHRHPFHPYNAQLPKDHSCSAANEAFFQCMSARPEDTPLHMKHVACYHPFKIDLMKCIADETRRIKALGGATQDQQ
jgi:hypothetical protein